MPTNKARFALLLPLVSFGATSEYLASNFVLNVLLPWSTVAIGVTKRKLVTCVNTKQGLHYRSLLFIRDGPLENLWEAGWVKYKENMCAREY